MARERLRRISRRRPAPGRVLEIGCALGFFLSEASRLEYDALGLDVSEFAVEHARDVLGQNARREDFLQAEFTETYDVIAAFYALEHFAEQKEAFRKIASLLRPGGIFAFALPSTHGPLFERSPERWEETHPVDHFADYSPASLKKILPLYGLRLLEARPASYHPERAGGIWKRLPALYRLYAKFACYGDTMEGIARKDERTDR